MCPNAWYTGKRRARTRWLHILCVIVAMCALFPLPTQALTLQDLYKFNSTYGDSQTEETDDGGSGQINLTVSFPFFKKKHNKLYVNNNGVVSFLKELKTYRPDDFPLQDSTPIIAPFWADVDVTEGGRVFYREERDSATLNKASNEVQTYFPNAHNFRATWMFIATWDRVGFYGASGAGENKTNTFQAILITNGRQSYVIFNYERIEWTTGSNSEGNAQTGLGGNTAQAGFNAGDTKTYYEIHGARTNAVINLTLTSNVNIPGKWFFRVDSAQIFGRCSETGSGSVHLFPSTGSMLGGHIVNFTNPCFNNGDNVMARIDDTNQTFPCRVIDETTASCVFPTIFITGRIQVSLNVNDSGWNYTGKYNVLNLVHSVGDIVRKNPEMWVIRKGRGHKVQMSWDPGRFPSNSVKIEFYSYKEPKTGPVLELFSSKKVESKNNALKVQLPKLQDLLCVIKISSSSVNDGIVPSIWSDVFPVKSNTAYSELMCNNWLKTESTLEAVTPGGPCPCTRGQASGDTGRYQPYPLCRSDSTSKSNCVYKPGAEDCIILNYQGSQTNSKVCCYDDKGELLNARVSAGGGTLIRYHYRSQGENIVPFFTYFTEDVLPSLHCCQYSSNKTLCEGFLKYRPPTSCQGYQPPAAAQAAGDPHIVTLDGKPYSFNGVGEYLLVGDKNKTVAVHVQTQRARDIDNVLQNATIFSAIVMLLPDVSDKLEILWEESQPVRVLVNGEETQLSCTSQLNGFTVYKNDTGSGTTEFTVVMDSVGMSVLVVSTEDLLNIMVMVGSPALKGQLEGLLGNYNGNQNDDFLSRNGILLSSEASMKEIHFQFGLTWRVPQNDSLFTAEDAISTDAGNLDASRDNFVPDFIDLMNDTQNPNSSQLCGENVQCKYDLKQTRNPAVAVATKKFNSRFEKILKDTQPVIRCPFVDDIPNGNLTISGYKVGSNVTFVCSEQYEFLRGQSDVIYCNKDGTWSGVFPNCVIVKEPTHPPSNTWIVVAVSTTGGFIAFIFIISLVTRHVCKKSNVIERKHYTKSDVNESESIELPQIFSPSPTDIPSPVFENPSFLESLQKLSSEAGRFRIPRPDFVDPNIYSEYF